MLQAKQNTPLARLDDTHHKQEAVEDLDEF